MPSLPAGGRFAIVTIRGHGMRWTRQSQVRRHGFRKEACGTPDERAPRTVKSCGPGAATLALRWRKPATGARKAASPGRARISRKAVARGKPGCPGCTCQTRVHSYFASAHGNAGAVGARLSLRPLFEEGATKMQNPGENLPREQWLSSRRRPGPIRRGGNWFWAIVVGFPSIRSDCGYGPRPSPGRPATRNVTPAAPSLALRPLAILV